MENTNKLFLSHLENSIKANPAEMAANMANLANQPFQFDQEGILDAADAEQNKNLLVLAAAWIKYFSNPNIYFDDRNKESISFCRLIAAMQSFRFLLEDVQEKPLYRAYIKMLDTPYSKYGSTLGTIHRTNMQTLSGFFFRVLDTSENVYAQMISTYMRQAYYHNWYELSFI